MAGSVFNAVGLDQGTRSQERALERGAGELRSALERVEGLYSPFSEAGLRGLERFEAGTQVSPENIVAGIEDDPFYQFQLKQGLGAVEGSAAARGNLRSGATLKDLTEFSQGLASSQIDKAFQREAQKQNELLQLIDIGLGTTGSTANAITRTAEGLAGIHKDIGDVKAERRAGMANFAGDAFSSAFAAFGGGGGGPMSFFSGGAI
jgi:hypothetical protein